MHPTIAGMIQYYKNKFLEICISNLCKLEIVKLYRLPIAEGFGGENGHICTCNMFTLEYCRNKMCKMAHLMQTEMYKGYPEKLVKIMSKGVAAVVTKPEGRKTG